MRTIIAAGLTAFLLTGTALAGPHGSGKLDVDGDGGLSLDEAMAGAVEHFDRLDENGDGYVSTQERETALAERRAKARERIVEKRGEEAAARFDEMADRHFGKRRGGDPLAKLDTNDDGFLSREEMIASATARFEKMDVDSDGVVTREERRKGKGRRHRRGDRD